MPLPPFLPNVSQHLSILKAAGIVAIRRQGRQVYCSLPIPEVKQTFDLMQDMLIHQIGNSVNLIS
jgi:DNA-binding transcriptional ArsR family regulator